MKIKYDQEVDVLMIQLSDSKVYESDESKPSNSRFDRKEVN